MYLESDPAGHPAGAPAERRPRYGALAMVAISCLAMGVCLTLLFLAMRGVMDLGGFVAAGGPYEIAHPAPDWVWVVPVSIVGGFLVGGVNLMAADRAGGYTLVLPIWCVLFLSLGWNFLEYGVRPPGGGLAWAWLMCAVLFFVMGLAPLLALLRPVGGFLKRKRALTRGDAETAGPGLHAAVTTPADTRDGGRRRFLIGYTLLVILSAGAGAVLGTLAFRALAA